MSILQNKSILVVDDEPEICELMKMELELEGCISVYTAENGRAAFEIVKTRNIDIVISDIRMAGGDGIELLENIKKFNPSKPHVILVTGFADITEAEAIKKGAVRVLNKPVTLNQILIELKNYLNS